MAKKQEVPSVKEANILKPKRHISFRRRIFRNSRNLILYGIFGVIILMVLIPLLTYLYFIQDLSSKDRIINRKNQGVILLDRTGEPFFTLFEARTKNTVPLAQIPLKTQQAFIAVEDKDFYKHPGFSITGIGRAIQTNIANEQFAAGGSTISQQLIKNTLLSQNKTIFRKYQELVLAIELERRYTKEDILEMYLNTTYFGEGAFGIEDASQKYFSKSVSDLTVDESALLAGIIRAPSALSPLSGDTEAAIERGDLIISLMQEQGYITADEASDALENEIAFTPEEEEVSDQGIHFALTVRDELIEEYGEQEIAQSGYVVTTTMDPSLQKTAQTAVFNRVRSLSGNDVSNGAAVAINPTNGQVLALVGSYDWSDEENGRINMAVAPRQPGSSFKPLMYAAALDQKIITAASQIDDKPFSFGGYKPENYDKRFRGQVLVRYALANSLNVPAVHIMEKIGVKNGISKARDFGITTLEDEKDYGLSLVLGAAEVPLIEMTSSFGTFANKGVHTDYTLYSEIKDKNGRVVKRVNPATRTVISDSVAYIISSILSDNSARQDTFGGSLTISRPAAVKTGTTDNYRDALTIGYTPQVVVGTWVGNNDNTPMDSIAGSLGAAPIWRQIMEAYLRGKPVVRFEKPSGIDDQLVCSTNGLKAEYATSSAYMEYFVYGTVPQGSCDLPPTVSAPNETQNPTNTPNPTAPQENPTATPQPTAVEIVTPTPQITEAPTPTDTINIPVL